MSMPGLFKPICNVCLTDVQGGKQGYLLSCGHFACNGCWRGGQLSVCPHCGNRGRAAPLEDPPAEVRDYVQNPLAQLRTTGDVLMFQIDHFRSVARQACKALHELRELHSAEVQRRNEAEKEASALRKRASEAPAGSRAGVSGRRVEGGLRGNNSAWIGGGVRCESAGGVRQDGSSSIDVFRQKFFRSAAVKRGGEGGFPSSPRAASPYGARPASGPGGGAREKLPPPRPSSAATGAEQMSTEAADAADCSSRVTASGNDEGVQQRGHTPQIQMGKSGRGEGRPMSSAARGLTGLAATTAGGTIVASPPGTSSGRPAVSAASQPNQPSSLEGQKHHSTPHSASESSLAARWGGDSKIAWVKRPSRGDMQAALPQRPETPGRPTRPAWQGGDSGREGGTPGSGMSTVSMGPAGAGRATPTMPTGGSRAMMSPLGQQQQHQQQRPQMRAAASTGTRRPTPWQADRGGGGGGVGIRRNGGQSPAASPSRNVQGGILMSPVPPVGFHPAISTPLTSPLLATTREACKRPLSGSLPLAKRPGSAYDTSHQVAEAQQERAESLFLKHAREGTPVTPFKATSASPRLRTPRLPYMARSGGPRPGSGRPNSGKVGSTPSVHAPDRQQQIHIPPKSPEAAGMFGLSAK